jgi:phage tail protein X
MIYIVQEPIRLDSIVYEHYGNLDVLVEVLEANSQYLTKYILDVGDKVILPNINIIKEDEGVALWD